MTAPGAAGAPDERGHGHRHAAGDPHDPGGAVAAGPPFPVPSILAGFRATTPVALVVGLYGVALGLVAATTADSVSLAELLVMDVLVLAGSSQIVAVGLWDDAVPIVSIVVATLVVNLRYILICATLHPIFEGRPLWVKLTGIHLVADENWAITLAAHRERRQPPGFLLGGGLAILVFWVLGCAIGFLVGGNLPPPEDLGLDFAFTAAFIGLALGFWRGKGDLWPWVAAGATSVLTHAVVGGTWHILVGGVSGALVAAATPAAPAAPAADPAGADAGTDGAPGPGQAGEA